jgi:hypothetical protein
VFGRASLTLAAPPEFRGSAPADKIAKFLAAAQLPGIMIFQSSGICFNQDIEFEWQYSIY